MARWSHWLQPIRAPCGSKAVLWIRDRGIPRRAPLGLNRARRCYTASALAARPRLRLHAEITATDEVDTMGSLRAGCTGAIAAVEHHDELTAGLLAVAKASLWRRSGSSLFVRSLEREHGNSTIGTGLISA